MLSFYDAIRERTFWINVDHIVSVTAVKRVRDVVALIEKKRGLSK